MTTGGEGGMVTCNDPELWKRMWAYKDHGKSWDAVYERNHPPGFRWLHESFGTNWRLTEMQSAIGRIQLRRMSDWQAKRAGNVAAITSALGPLAGPDGPVRLTQNQCFGCNGDCGGGTGCRHAYYKFYVFVRPENLPDGMTRDDVIDRFTAQGAPCMQGSCSEMYLEKAFDGTGLRPTSRLPVARTLGDTSIVFMVHPGMDYTDLMLTLD